MSDSNPMTEARLAAIEAAAQLRSCAPLYAGEAQHMADLALEVVAEVRRLAGNLERIRTVVGVMRTPPLTTGNMASELARLRREVGLGESTP